MELVSHASDDRQGFLSQFASFINGHCQNPLCLGLRVETVLIRSGDDGAYKRQATRDTRQYWRPQTIYNRRGCKATVHLLPLLLLNGGAAQSREQTAEFARIHWLHEMMIEHRLARTASVLLLTIAGALVSLSHVG